MSHKDIEKKSESTTRNGLVVRVTPEETTKRLRAKDRSEYRKRTRQNKGNRANIAPFRF